MEKDHELSITGKWQVVLGDDFSFKVLRNNIHKDLFLCISVTLLRPFKTG
jgi:hypothetical protein